MSNLRPSHFCGSSSLVEEALGASKSKGICYQLCWVECANCGTSGPTVELNDGAEAQNNYQLVRDEWNKRNE